MEKKENNLKIDGDTTRWIYEYKKWKNLDAVWLYGKIALITAFISAIVMILTEYSKGAWKAFGLGGISFGITSMIMILILIGIYFSGSILDGGKYLFVFEMNENGIRHIQIQNQFKKSDMAEVLNSKNETNSTTGEGIGSNLLSKSNISMYSNFSKIKKIRINRKKGIITLKEKFSTNYIYVLNEDLIYISQYINDHCKKAKIFSK